MRIEEPVPNERLRDARLAKGWTQSELAEMLDTDFETVSRWERGVSTPNPYFRQRLSSALDKAAQELGLTWDLKEPLSLPASPYVFLATSYADAESKFITHLKLSSQAKGLAIVSGRTVRRQGVVYQSRALQETIRGAQAVLLIVSLADRASRHVQETLRIASIYRSRVCAVFIEGQDWQECLPKESGEFIAMIDAREKNQDQVCEEIIAALGKTASAAEETARLLPEPRNPYKGLKAFQSEDQRDFFGRDAAVGKLGAALQAKLRAGPQETDDARLLAIVGPSGSGKSSIVLAGLLPRLREGLLPGSEEWVYLDPVLPGAHPLASLARAFARHMPARSMQTILEELEDDAALGLHVLASQLQRRPDSMVVLFVDQFEEVFTQTTSEEERRHFLNLLVTAVECQGATIVILTLRADFYDRPMHYPEFCTDLQASQRLLLPMNVQELREAVEKPARLSDVQLTFEGDLIGDLLFEVQGQVGALPLLQFTLEQLFERRSGRMLTLQAYHEIGGVKGILARHAEQTYAGLPSEEHRRIARALFLRLIDPGITEADTTRRRADFSEFTLVDATRTNLLRETIDAFTTARLLTTSGSEGTTMLEVSHEALLREWPRLNDWLHEAREDIPLQQAISKDVAEWEGHEKPRDRLYRGSQLKEALGWANRNTPSGNEAAFLSASKAQQKRALVRAIGIALLFILISGIAIALSSQLQRSPQSVNPTVVTNLNDTGTGSLRWTLEHARPGSTITFAKSGQINLTSGDLVISQNLNLRGPKGGVTIFTATGAGVPSSLRIGPGTSVTIDNLTFDRANIYNQGTLTLSNSSVSDNNTNTSGGGIFNNGTLTLINSGVYNNTTTNANGGGIYNDVSSTLTLIHSTIDGNTAGYNGIVPSSPISNPSNCRDNPPGGGGGIYNLGALTLTDSLISGNYAESGSGGGILNTFPPSANSSDLAKLTLTNSIISQNAADGDGGGIANPCPWASMNITFSTIFDNQARGNGGGIAFTTAYKGYPTLQLCNSIPEGTEGLQRCTKGLTCDTLEA